MLSLNFVDDLEILMLLNVQKGNTRKFSLWGPGNGTWKLKAPLSVKAHARMHRSMHRCSLGALAADCTGGSAHGPHA
jgi:hypothetical protein